MAKKKRKSRKITNPNMYDAGGYLSSIGQGALSGASMGAQFGGNPYAIAGGAIVGGVLGGVQQHKLEEEQKVLERQQTQDMYNQQAMFDQMQRPMYFGMGGSIGKKLINIEKGELEIEPKNFNVIRDYKLRPPHPKDENMMDMGGNVEANVNNFIIPRKYRDEFLEASKRGNKLKQEALVHNIQVEKDAQLAADEAKMERGGAINFKSGAAYKKWLAYGHASGEFAKTPGHQKVSIRGKAKDVKHDMGGPVDPNGPNDAQAKMMRRFMHKLGMTPMFNYGGDITEMYGNGGQLYPYNVKGAKSKISVENGRVGPKNRRLGKYARHGIQRGMKGHVGAEFHYPGGKRAFRFEEGSFVGPQQEDFYNQPIMYQDQGYASRFPSYGLGEPTPMAFSDIPQETQQPAQSPTSSGAQIGPQYQGAFGASGIPTRPAVPAPAPFDMSKLSGTVNNLASNAPYLYDLARSSFDRPFQYDADKYKQKNRISYRDVNFSPIQRAIEQQGNIARANAASAAGGGAGSFLSNQAQISANTAGTQADAMMKAQQLNAQNRYIVDVQNLGIDQANKNLQLSIDQMNRANIGAKSQMFHQGLEGLSGITQQRMHEKNQADRDVDYLALFKQLYPTLSQFKG